MALTKHSSGDYDETAPRAAAMIESLRAFGYDLPTALADLVDNSISAGAKRLWLHFHWDGPASCIVLRDDGCGMSEAELVNAMRPGSFSPAEARAPKDLGRFGLGLKTASFSQCRLLTVSSRCKGEEAALRCWNLDYVVACDAWRLLRNAPEGAVEHLESVGLTDSGTIVLWQRLDRLAGTESSDAAAQNHFYAALDEVKSHLSMTFYDYLHGRGAVQIFINGHQLEGWDPFLSSHEATQILPEETLHWGGNTAVVRPYILPHHTRLGKEWEGAGGPQGWNAHQGFYIYRNRRLLVAGDWLGTGFSREEHYKLARIRVDLTNDTDVDWQLDVKKSRAWPPSALRDPLLRIARVARKHASDIYRHRGARLLPQAGAERLHLWEQQKRRGKKFYKINVEHPLVQCVIAASPQPVAVRAMLKMLQETVPLPLIAINNAEDPQGHAAPFEQAPTHQVQIVMRHVYKALMQSGHSSAEARLRLAQMDAFEDFPELLATLDEEADDEDALMEREDEIGINS